MKILFIFPNKDQFGSKPISISLLSAILKRQGHKVELFDTSFIDFGYTDNNEDKKKLRIFHQVDWNGYDISKKNISMEQELIEKLNSFEPDIVSVSALSDEIYIGFEISKIVKQWNCTTPVIWGNKAATTEPDKVLSSKDVDYVCIGEGIEALPEFIDCIEQGKDPQSIQNLAYHSENGAIIRNPLRPYFKDLDSLPFLDWSIYDKRHFFKPFDGKIIRGGDYTFAWGCPNKCTYCINTPYQELYGRQAGRYIRYYSVGRAIRELKYLKDTWGIQLFVFHDEDFSFKPMSYLKELSGAYRLYVNVPFSCMVNAKNITEEKVKLLKNMKCISVSIGIETGNTELRRNVLKRYESVTDIIRATKLFNKAGIRTSSFNMLGIPFETRETIFETIEVNKKAEVRYPNCNFFFPYEGTELKEIAVKNGMFKSESDVYTNDKPALTLPGVSEEELIALRERFVLYIKMPEKYHQFIERSETKDEIGRRLTETLFDIYDKCVLANNGIWNDNGNGKMFLEELWKSLQ